MSGNSSGGGFDFSFNTDDAVSRRDFVKLAAGGAAAVAATQAFAAESRQGDMLYRQLGRTGAKVSAIGLGGFHIGNPPEAEGIKIIRSAIDRGITFLDNCWDY